MQGLDGSILICWLLIIVSDPNGPVAIKLIVKSPNDVYVWEGLKSVLVLPSPKSHINDRALVELFWKFTWAGTSHNRVSEAIKLAEGGNVIGKSVFQIPLP